jgi:aminobenzoyl-glutamate utilization protein B
MSRSPLSLLLIAASLGGLFFPSAAVRAGKPELLAEITALEETAWQDALRIWDWAEPGYQEQKSSTLLAERLEQSGFKVTRGVAEIPTAFVAEFGSGQPVLGLLAEFDALPGLSQEAVPERRPRQPGGLGHACGHHLFGVAAVTAARAIAQRMRAGEITGTVRLYGCPAEEGGGAKVFLARAGLFRDCAAVLHWHPGSRNAAGDASCLARISAKFRFHGTAAHAAGAPHEGRSALDAVELMNHAAQLLREHTPDGTRIHHVITAGGDAPNVVPEFAEVYYYVRHPDSRVAANVFKRLELCAQAGALATETRLETEHHGGTLEILPNKVLADVAMANLKALNTLEYNPEETAFALRLRETLGTPVPLESIRQVIDQTGTTVKGSTDVGDVSWVVPTTGFNAACWVPGTASHSWQAVAAGGTTIGRQGMLLASRVLAASAWDLYHQPATLTAARDELQRRLGDRRYEPLMPVDLKPRLDYRKSRSE